MKTKLLVTLCAFFVVAGSSTNAAPTKSQPIHFNSPDWAAYQSIVLAGQAAIPGWCPIEKAKRMMDLVYEVKPQVCVEIGVFGGSSIYPTACALKFLNTGVVHAIDPWAAVDCLEGYAADDPNYKWWSTVDLEKIYKDFCGMLSFYQLNDYCNVMRTTGLLASKTFADESIDILHIDGNHTEKVALQDAQIYLPKVKQGGYIWFDDINWTTTGAAYAYLIQYCELVAEKSTDAYCLFRKL